MKRVAVIVLMAIVALMCLGLWAVNAPHRYASFDLPNGDRILIDRVGYDLDLGIPQLCYRVRSEHRLVPKLRRAFHTTMTDDHPVYKVIGPGSDSVVAVVSSLYPTNAVILYDFRDGTCLPYDWCPDDVAPRSDDPRFPPLEQAYSAKASELLERVAKSTGARMSFADPNRAAAISIEAEPSGLSQ